MPTKDCVANECEADFFIDITEDICPITFVRTKLLIERMAAGQTAELRVRGAEPLANLPRAITLQGHTVIALEPEADPPAGRSQSPADPHGVHRLRFRKA